MARKSTVRFAIGLWGCDVAPIGWKTANQSIAMALGENYQPHQLEIINDSFNGRVNRNCPTVSLFWDCLKFVANNSRFLTLPDGHDPNLGSRTLSLWQKRLLADWQDTFDHPVVLLVTFVDPQHFRGTVSIEWLTGCMWARPKVFARRRKDYSAKPHSPPKVSAPSHRKSANSHAMSVWFSITCG